jgi:riboflavin kinase/FMN adenylyltransferase
VQIIRGYKSIPEGLGPMVMTIGTYDGLHLGHRAIIQRVVTHARREGVPALVYSFYPPPWRLLGRAEHPYLILTLKEKIERMRALGVDVLLTEEFTPELRALSHLDFADEVLYRQLNAQEIHVGYDFGFGKGRAGDWRFLQDHLGPRGVTVRPHGAVRLDGGIIGCRLIRAHVVEGRVAQAAVLLGQRHVVRGTVIHGDKRGRTIGFPTANVDPDTELVPGIGVYAVTLRLPGSSEELKGIANVGVRPTFGGDPTKRVEVHLFDWEGDIYGEEVLVSFAFRVRDEQTFDGIESLTEQIRADVLSVRRRDEWPTVGAAAERLTWDPKPI